MHQSKLAVSILIMFMFVAGLGIGFFLFKTLNEADSIAPQRTENKRYFSDELILSGKDKQGTLFFVHLRLNRKQTAFGKYTHYYVYETITDSKTKLSEFNTEDAGNAILSGGIVSNLVNTHAEDFSTRENYSFHLSINGEEYEVKTSQFEGDFLLKNSLDYTRYASVGKATVISNNITFTVNALLVNSYAEDYSKYVFFDGYDELESTTKVLAFWDSTDNFYFIDQSLAKSVQENYQSHTWVLYKNNNGETRKSFTAIISHPTDGENPKDWNISLPELGNTRAQAEVQYYQNKRAAGIVVGHVITSKGSLPIHGYAIYAEY